MGMGLGVNSDGWSKFVLIRRLAAISDDWTGAELYVQVATGAKFKAHGSMQAFWAASYVATKCTCIICLALSVLRGAASAASP